MLWYSNLVLSNWLSIPRTSFPVRPEISLSPLRTSFLEPRNGLSSVPLLRLGLCCCLALVSLCLLRSNSDPTFDLPGTQRPGSFLIPRSSASVSLPQDLLRSCFPELSWTWNSALYKKKSLQENIEKLDLSDNQSDATVGNGYVSHRVTSASDDHIEPCLVVFRSAQLCVTLRRTGVFGVDIKGLVMFMRVLCCAREPRG